MQEEIYLGFKAFDIHELACHFVAQHAGLYQTADLRVRLVDTTFIADEELPLATFQAGCGAALAAWLQGAPLKVVFVATERPMFWLYGLPDIASLEDLRGRRIAGYPAVAPPAHFLSTILKAAKIDPTTEVLIVPARDDVARLGLLRARSVDAAVLSSAVLPSQAERHGLRQLAFFGDTIRVPTTGLAVRQALLDKERQLVATLCRCYQESLQMLHADEQLLRSALAAFTEFTGGDLMTACQTVQACYTADGRGDPHAIDQGVKLMQGALGLPDVLPTERLYDFAVLLNQSE